jgi:hypothetical protein
LKGAHEAGVDEREIRCKHVVVAHVERVEQTVCRVGRRKLRVLDSDIVPRYTAISGSSRD